MALQPREKKLAIIVGGMGIALMAWLVFGGVRQAFQTRQTQLDAANRELRDKNFRVARAASALEQFADWESRSLPRDRETARSAYQGRLVATLAEAKLANVQVDPGRTAEVKGVYAKLPFTVRAQGSAAAISRWLAAFYRADDLHQIRDLSLQPIGGGDLQMTANIEALSLPGADRADALTKSVGGRLDEARAAAAQKSIVERNLFAAYVPPPPPRPPVTPVRTPPPPPPPPPAFDDAKHTYLTSVVSVAGEPEAWLSIRTKQETLKLHAGDDIQVGRFQGKLVRIGPAEIEVEQDGKRRTVALGKSLTAAPESEGS